MTKILGLTVLVSTLVTPLAASAAPASTSTTVSLVTQPAAPTSAPAAPLGPSAAALLTPLQFDVAWQNYIDEHVNVDHSS